MHSAIFLVVPEKRFVERSFCLVISHLFYGGKRSRSDGTLIFVLDLRGATICCQKMKTAVHVHVHVHVHVLVPGTCTAATGNDTAAVQVL